MRTLLVGGTSLIAKQLIPIFNDLMVITGRPWDAPQGVGHALVELSRYDGSHTHHWMGHYDNALFIAPLQLSVRLLDYLQQPCNTRAVFLSSNNAALLGNNADYAALTEAEARILNSDLNAIILQPTAISGRPGDPVLSHIVEHIRSDKRLYFPGADTRHNLVDYRDVARAIHHALDRNIPKGRYSVAGSETLTYANLVERLQTALWQPASMSSVPKLAVRIAGQLVPERADYRRAGKHRDPVNPPLPGFVPQYGISDMLQCLTEVETIPS